MGTKGRQALPFLVLVLGLVGTLAAAFAFAQAEEAAQEARFEGLVDNAVGAIEQRMLAQLTLLRGAAGFFNASEDVSREEFREYVDRLRLQRYYPGVLGLGFAAFAPDRPGIEQVAARARREVDPGFRAWPEGPREDYSAILFLEPLNRLNRAAIGFDMLSEPARRRAMMASAAAGASRMTGRVQLVQEIDPVKQPGFLIYVAVFEPGPGPAADRPLRGWVYSPLRAHDLFGAVFSAHDLSQTLVEVYDDRVDPANLLYRSGEAQASPGREAVRRIQVSGRPWTIRVVATEAFAARAPRTLGLLVGVGGTLITLLVSILLLQQIRAAARTEKVVEARTAELSEANRALLDEAKAREEAEAQVRHMQKMEAIGHLTGGIAHDFNNMLAVVIGNLELAERRLDQPEKLRKVIDSARSGAAKAAELTQRLLAFGRQQALAPRAIDPNQLVGGMLDLLRRSLSEAIRVETDLVPGAWTVHADASQLESAILNIAINARDAMPEGGRLTLGTRNRVVTDVAAAGEEELAPGEYAAITIEDTGRGMPPDVAARAMDPFFTTKEVGKGSGLGLSQVYGFARQSGGTLLLDSREGEGTRVTLLLPRHRGAAEAGPADAADRRDLPAGRSSETILVVEDEPDVLDMSVETLRDLGYDVISARDPREALAEIDRNPDIDLLFTDVVMPGMDGRTLAQSARALRPALRILFTTGYSSEAVARHGQLAEGVSLLPKPFSSAELALAVRRELDGEG